MTVDGPQLEAIRRHWKTVVGGVASLSDADLALEVADRAGAVRLLAQQAHPEWSPDQHEGFADWLRGPLVEAARRLQRKEASPCS